MGCGRGKDEGLTGSQRLQLAKGMAYAQYRAVSDAVSVGGCVGCIDSLRDTSI